MSNGLPWNDSFILGEMKLCCSESLRQAIGSSKFFQEAAAAAAATTEATATAATEAAASGKLCCRLLALVNFRVQLPCASKLRRLNHIGRDEIEELQKVLSRFGLWDEREGQDCKSMINMFDTNSDGLLDFEEFRTMMVSSS
nr:probable calcium-binding protein CML25/26 [Coffea arabica]